MIELKCDRCGESCDLQARVIDVHVVSNPNPVRFEDIGEICLTDNSSHIRYMLCQKCYDKLRFPNPYCKGEKLVAEIKNSGADCIERHGEWLVSGDCYECSECGGGSTVGTNPYCWKCGAKMSQANEEG